MLIETLTCHLAAGVDETAFLAADRRVQTEFIPNQPGFVRRTTARGGGDQVSEWFVVTLWGGADAADESAKLGRSDPVMADFEALIENPVVRRYETLD